LLKSNQSEKAMNHEDEDFLLNLEFLGMVPEERNKFWSELDDEERADLKAAFRRAGQLKYLRFGNGRRIVSETRPVTSRAREACAELRSDAVVTLIQISESWHLLEETDKGERASARALEIVRSLNLLSTRGFFSPDFSKKLADRCYRFEQQLRSMSRRTVRINRNFQRADLKPHWPEKKSPPP
jgi:hypothetical protein